MIRNLIIITFGLAMMWVNTIYAQVPQGMSYQSVIRNSSGAPQISTPVAVRFSILQGSATGTSVYVETQSFTTTTQGIVTGTIGLGTPTQGTFSTINWSSGSYFLKVEADINNQGTYSLSGTSPIVSVPYSLYSGKAGSLAATGGASGNVLTWDGANADPNVALFEVKDKKGNPIFSVYPTGVEIVFDETAPQRGSKGGFAVSGRNSTRAVVDIMRMTTDSTTVYVNSLAKRGSKGGFAVSGRNSTRQGGSNYFSVNSFTTQVATASATEGFTISDNSAVGEVTYLKLLPKNYFIGYQTGNAIQKGEYNIFLGYQAGFNTTGFHGDMEPTDGDNNIFIGYQSGFGNTVGEQNVYIGAFSGKGNETGIENTFVGALTGQLNSGYGNTFLGSRAGGTFQPNTGVRNTFVGCYSGQNNTTGSDNVFIGRESGSANLSGNDNVYIGHLAGLSNIGGTGNVFIGKGAGQNELSSNKLYIANSANQSLVTGDFTAKKFNIDGDLTASTVNNPSDQRLKKNISTIPNALTKVLNLRGVNFEWKDTTMKGKQIGFIAQEVEKVVPEVVNYSKEKDLYTLQYAPVTALLVEAMKEQQKTIDQLKAENEMLKKQMEEIKQMVLQLKK